MIKDFIDNVNFYELAKFISLFKKDDSPYKILPYVRTDGRQYVNIGSPQNLAFYSECVFEYTEIYNRENAIFGNWSDDNKDHITYGIENGVQRVVGYGSLAGFNSIQNGEPVINTLYNVRLENIDMFNPPHKMYINDTEYINTAGRSLNVGDEPFYLFCNGLVNRFLSSVKLYSFKIGADGLADQNITCNLIPAKRKSDNKIGLYDTIRDQFYTSSSGYDLLYP